jgi:hypothetical protein
VETRGIQKEPSRDAPLMTTTASFDTATFIVPATDDLHDRAYRFGKPLAYLSDRQQVRLFILRSRVHEARPASTPKAA